MWEKEGGGGLVGEDKYVQPTVRCIGRCAYVNAVAAGHEAHPRVPSFSHKRWEHSTTRTANQLIEYNNETKQACNQLKITKRGINQPTNPSIHQSINQ